MNEGDRALDLWLAEHVKGMKLRDTGENSCELWSEHEQRWIACTQQGTHYTEDDYPLLVTALQNEPHKFEVCLWFYPARPWAPAHCEASIWAEGRPSPVAEKSADTPGLALGRAAEQALKGDE